MDVTVSDKLPRVITISGKAGSGKDTLGRFIQENLESTGRRVLTTHYADLLKYICTTYFGWDGKKDEAGRDLLQTVGTDIFRKANENFWIDFIIEFLLIVGPTWDYVIIPDARFPNEIERPREFFNLTAINAARKHYHPTVSGPALAHISENALSDFRFDMTVADETLDELKSSAASIAAYLITQEQELAAADQEPEIAAVTAAASAT